MNEKHRHIFTNFTHWFPDGTGFSIPGWVLFNDYIQKLKKMSPEDREFKRMCNRIARGMGRRIAEANFKALYNRPICE